MLSRSLRFLVWPARPCARLATRPLSTFHPVSAENSPTPPANPTASRTAPDSKTGKSSPNEVSASDAPPEERSIKSKDEELGQRPLRSKAEEHQEGKYGSGEKLDQPAEPK